MAKTGAVALDPRRIPMNIDRAVAAARRARPGKDALFIAFPGSDFSSPRHYGVMLFGKQTYNKHLFDIALVDAVTSEVAAVTDMPLYAKAMFLSEPPHFGNYGGLPLKLLWVTSALLTLFITGNGAWLWWRRRARSAPAAAAAVSRSPS